MTDLRSSRIDALQQEAMNGDQRRVHEAITAGPRGSVPAPLAVWMHSPRLAETAQELGRFLRYESSLPPRLSELAILVTGSIWQAEYEWWVHRPIAENAGVDATVIDALREGRAPQFTRADEQSVYDFTSQLHLNRGVDESTYQTASELLGEIGVVDLVGLCGYYTLISMTLKAFDVQLPEGAAGSFNSRGHS